MTVTFKNCDLYDYNNAISAVKPSIEFHGCKQTAGKLITKASPGKYMCVCNAIITSYEDHWPVNGPRKCTSPSHRLDPMKWTNGVLTHAMIQKYMARQHAVIGGTEVHVSKSGLFPVIDSKKDGEILVHVDTGLVYVNVQCTNWTLAGKVVD